jgi:phage portal protein BeeE
MFGCRGKSSLISESVAEIQINIHLARENLRTQRIHGLKDLTYDNPSQSPSNVEFTLLHWG